MNKNLKTQTRVCERNSLKKYHVINKQDSFQFVCKNEFQVGITEKRVSESKKALRKS